MPTYDYKCLNCNFTFEHFQPMSAEPLADCPKCGGTLKRVIGAGAGPIFKGSGFYQTDYKGKSSSDKKDSKEQSKPATETKKPIDGDKKE
ncbi:MAG: FmdB family zinc ribbon protein [Ignavibacteriales bacterium]